MKSNETTNTDKDYQAWLKTMDGKSDIECSYEILKRVLEKGNIDSGSKELLKAAHEYCVKLIQQDKPLELNLLKIYLQDIKGYELSHINMVSLTAMLALCGIEFSKIS